MKFQMPETLDGLTLAAVTELHQAALAEARELNTIADDAMTSEQVEDLVSLMDSIATLAETRGTIEAADQARAEALASARERLAAAEEAPAEEVNLEEIEIVDLTQESEQEPELIAASVKPKHFASKASKKAPEPVGQVEKTGEASLTASANIPGFTSGQSLKDFRELAEAFVARGKMFASSNTRRSGKPGRPSRTLSSGAQRFSVAQLAKPASEFTITEKMSAGEQFDLIKRAANEKRLGGGSLLASGGWCAPSEQIWDFLELEGTGGMLSIPELMAPRGGITFTPGPQIASLLASATLGFVQTEAEAEAGDEKPIFDIECPDWDEVRLDAIGYALRAPLLTRSAYPELIRRYLGLGLIVHQRRVNAATIARIQTKIGTATAFGAIGSPASDTLHAVELGVLRERYLHSMDPDATVEAVMPLWAKAVFRADLSRRNGVDMISVSDAQIDGWFRDRGALVQYVYDYQNLVTGAVTVPGGTAAWTALPDELEFMLYPAGSFVRLGTDVIDIDTVYDTDGLTGNVYTAAFFEEGFNVANTGGTGVKYTVALANYNGETGFPAIGAGEGVTIPVVP